MCIICLEAGVWPAYFALPNAALKFHRYFFIIREVSHNEFRWKFRRLLKTRRRNEAL